MGARTRLACPLAVLSVAGIAAALAAAERAQAIGRAREAGTVRQSTML